MTAISPAGERRTRRRRACVALWIGIGPGIGLIASGASALAMSHPRFWPFTHQEDCALIAAGVVLVVFSVIAVRFFTSASAAPTR